MLRTTLLFCFVLAACSSHTTAQEPYVPPAGDVISEQVDGTCPSPPAALRGTTPAGSACTEGADCAPTCCSCNNGTNRKWLAVHCSSKVCAGVDQACADTLKDAPDLCTVP